MKFQLLKSPLKDIGFWLVSECFQKKTNKHNAPPIQFGIDVEKKDIAILLNKILT